MVSSSQPAPRPIAVGDRVRFMYGDQTTVAEVVEDRGNIGYRGRHLIRIRVVQSDPSDEFEIAADEVQLIPSDR